MRTSRFVTSTRRSPPTPLTADGKLASDPVHDWRACASTAQTSMAGTPRQVGDITTVNLTGPDVKLNASGRHRARSHERLQFEVSRRRDQLAELAAPRGAGGRRRQRRCSTARSRAMRASLTADGTLNGSNLGYEENSVLDLNSRYTVSVPELDFAKAHVEATSDATFVKVAGMELNSVTATTTYDQTPAGLQDEHQGEDPRAGRHRAGSAASGSPGSAPPRARDPHAGSRVANRAGEPGDRELQRQPRAARGRAAGQRRPVARTDRSTGGRNGAVNRGDRRPRKQCRYAAAPDAGAAGPRPLRHASPRTRGFPARPPHPSSTAPSRSTTAGSRRITTIRFAVKVDYAGTRIGIDATLQQSPTEAITAKGSVPTTLFQASPGTGHVEPAPGDAIDLQVKSTSVNLAIVQGFTTLLTNVTGTIEADVHVGGSGRDPHLQGYRRHQEWRVQRAGGGRHVLRHDDEDRSRARSHADPAVRAPRPP